MTTDVDVFPEICPFEAIYQSAGHNYGIEWTILAAQGKFESDFDPQAVGTKGEMGLGQIMPDTWKQWGEGDPFDPTDNIAAQARYMSFLHTALAGRGKVQWKWTIAAYNWGIGNVLKVEDYNEIPQRVRNYVVSVYSAAMIYAAREARQLLTVHVGFGQACAEEAELWRKRIDASRTRFAYLKEKGGDKGE